MMHLLQESGRLQIFHGNPATRLSCGRKALENVLREQIGFDIDRLATPQGVQRRPMPRFRDQAHPKPVSVQS
jgi:hypothetical protein